MLRLNVAWIPAVSGKRMVPGSVFARMTSACQEMTVLVLVPLVIAPFDPCLHSPHVRALTLYYFLQFFSTLVKMTWKKSSESGKQKH